MAVQPYDEQDLSDEDKLIRRVNPQHHLVHDENTGQMRTSSKLFSPSSASDGGMSVDVLKLIEQHGVDAKEFVTTPDYTGSVIFPVEAARNTGLRVGYEPIENNPYHAEVWGNSKPNRFSRSQKREMVTASEWFGELPGVVIGV